MEVEGITTFSDPPTTSYRYALKLENDKLSIWMEDRTTKKQWYKGAMAKADYVTSANSVTDASVGDYLKCFQDALDGELDETGDIQRTLEFRTGGALRLSFSVKFRVLRSMRVAKYTFKLDSVSVERIDVLESKLRDLQEELEKGGKVHPVKFTTSKKNGSILLWSPIVVGEFASTSLDGDVQIVREGIYNIAVIVNLVCHNQNQIVQLLMNDELLQMVYATYCGYGTSVSLNTTERLEKNDKLTIRCDCNLSGTSDLTITRLGN
ncbi:hypothetical protein PHMEG_00026755 [Phytophthora megakarya]|uniref:Uncharacterized protein n=1 Tax=Phytophthora megakarya TaxID=4795 RepID=A0A225V9N1_9STRA|nr:hypothetical protein PHMEG_00026755 [Phytophthora megakarya]